MTTQNRAQRRAQGKAVKDGIKQTFPMAAQEEWKRVDGPFGFEYRHVTALGKSFTVRGVWPRVAIAAAAIAGAAGVVVGHLLW